MKDILAIVGIVAILVWIFVMGTFLLDYICELVSILTWRYKYKHRFDKTPTAKCYCVDCIYRDNKTHRCYRFHEDSTRCVADDWFCYGAEPRKKGEC